MVSFMMFGFVTAPSLRFLGESGGRFHGFPWLAIQGCMKKHVQYVTIV